MKLLDLTLPSPAENVALDEALLESAENAGSAGEVLRLWESPQPAVVVGRASKVAEEVDLVHCRRAQIPVLRRCSGGAAVVIGPGCLMYAVILSLELRPALRSVEHAHRFVLSRTAAALERCQLAAGLRGTSDLALGDRKISGNSLRCKRLSLLYHGTILYALSGEMIQQCLRTPPRQPDYRLQRSHAEFVTRVPRNAAELRSALVAAWEPEGVLASWPRDLTQQLVAERYLREEWNYRL